VDPLSVWSEVSTASAELPDAAAVVYPVLRAAAQSASDDVQQIMVEVRARAAAKRALRDVITKVNRDLVESTIASLAGDSVRFAANGLGGAAAYHAVPLPVVDTEAAGGIRMTQVDLVVGRDTTTADVQAVKDQLDGQLDSMSELSEMQSLRLQMAMDRLSKLMTTLSNVLKKIDETDSAITQNLK
jgi:hypothetical protein